MNQFDVTKRIMDLNCKDYNLTPTEKHVLITLSGYLGFKDGVLSCYPSQTTLSAKTGYATRTVISALKSLEDKKVIKSRFTKGATKLYTISLINDL